jgi:mannose-6-phosphate isomerase-like protein (cupin superfamily)
MSDLAWPPELDALVAAPENHRLLLENDRVRVLDTEIAPGERTPLHTHRWPAVHYIVSWSDFVRRDANDATLVDTRGRGALSGAMWGPPLGPHSLENVGSRPIRVISVEVKS